MALARPGPLVAGISGTLGSCVFAITRAGQLIRHRPRARTHTTPAQMEQRALYALATKSWHELSDANRQSWLRAALTSPTTAHAGSQRRPNGYQLYIRQALWQLALGAEPLDYYDAVQEWPPDLPYAPYWPPQGPLETGFTVANWGSLYWLSTHAVQLIPPGSRIQWHRTRRIYHNWHQGQIHDLTTPASQHGITPLAGHQYALHSRYGLSTSLVQRDHRALLTIPNLTENKIVNSDFETSWATQWPPNWTGWGNATTSRGTLTPYLHSGYCIFTATLAAGVKVMTQSPVMKCTIGHTYRTRLCVMPYSIPPRDILLYSPETGVQMLWTDFTPAGPDSWAIRMKDWVANASSNSLQLRINVADGITGTFYLDNISFRELLS